MTSLTDTLVGHLDLALKTLVPGSATPSRVNPADNVTDQPDLSAPEEKHAAGLMRINHTGEVCAQALYQGQSLTARLPEVRESMEQAAREEIDHLAWCETRLKELESSPSLLNPLWYGMSFGLGALAGLAGDKWSLGFVAETEKQVGVHLNEHLDKLPEKDKKSREILTRMLTDEASHEEAARAAGGAELPESVKTAMGLMSGVMKTGAYCI